MSEFDGSSILVTGGSGSFGRHFIRTLLERHKPRRVAVFSRDELKQYHMSQDPAFADRPEMRYFIGDVRDADRLELAMHGVDMVVHAAALKHVSAAEYNPFECIKTNVNGSQNVVQAALRARIAKVMMISTDKATNPVNLYGASKLAGEKIFVAANNLRGADGPRFAVVRYGNVMGSSGSVIPHFRRLIEEGATRLPITDERMTRFFITLDQGVDFVLSMISQMQGGEIFVPKIPSVRTIDIAEVLAPGIDIDVVGIRPGEKLHEVLVSEDESRKGLELPSHYLIEPVFSFWQRDTHVEPDAVALPDGFRYASDSNRDWLDQDDLRALLRDLGIAA